MRKDNDNWSHVIFVGICTISFACVLVFELGIPIKLALTYGLPPIGVLVIISLCSSCFGKWKPKDWKNHYKIVAENEKYTEFIKSLLFPIILVILYFYIRGEDGQEFLYNTSPVKCDMTIHACGSSYFLNDPTEVWDAAELISQLSHEDVFIVTNTVAGKQQTRGICPQTGAHCSSTNINPGRKSPKWLETTTWTFAHQFSRAAIWNPVTCQRPGENSACDLGVLYDNGIQTGNCENDRFCNVVGWCPLIKLDDFSSEARFQTENFTVFLDLKPSFPDFRGPSWTNGGERGYSANYADVYAKHYGYRRSVGSCLYHPTNDPYCPRFRLEDIVKLSPNEGEVEEVINFAEVAAYGGQFKIEVDWSCRFDWGLDIFNCLPEFRFYNLETNKGKPKIFPKITSQNMNNRTITYNLGIHVSIAHVGHGTQIQFFNVVLYAQFIFVSFAMIKGPFLWVVRCLITIFMLSCR